MSLKSLASKFLPAVEQEMQDVVSIVSKPGIGPLYEMLTYHMGWSGESAGPRAQGKRVRPLLVGLTTLAAGQAAERAVPAGAAVELLHNFSLIHDDIQDNSPLRRGRPTLWTMWGIAQAINAGDAMFSLAHQAIFGLEKYLSSEEVLEAAKILHETCNLLTQGQYLDISYETRSVIELDDYWNMIGGKTAALLAACMDLGALAAGADAAKRSAYRDFGRNLGLAFQVQDDLLGIWGDAEMTGKSVESDLVKGKKSLPVVYGLAKNAEFAARWEIGPITIEEVPEVSDVLEAEGARAYTQQKADELTSKALQSLEEADPRGESGQALVDLANELLSRKT